MALTQKDKTIIYPTFLLPLIISIIVAFSYRIWYGLLNLLIVIIWIWSYRGTANYMVKYDGISKKTGRIILVITVVTSLPIISALLTWNIFLGAILLIMLYLSWRYFTRKNCINCSNYCPFNLDPQKRYKPE